MQETPWMAGWANCGCQRQGQEGSGLRAGQPLQSGAQEKKAEALLAMPLLGRLIAVFTGAVFSKAEWMESVSMRWAGGQSLDSGLAQAFLPPSELGRSGSRTSGGVGL